MAAAPMRPPRRRSVRELEDLTSLLRQGADLRGFALQDIDLREAAISWERMRLEGTLLLGCPLPPGARETIEARGGTVFPRFGARPYNPYRSTLYTPEELCAVAGAGRTRDEEIHAFYVAAGASFPDVGEALAQRVHDHAIDDALADLVGHDSAARLARRIVGVMGGHAVPRDAPAYREAARVAWLLGSDHLIVTGGGPGVMEAANLGAALAGRPEADFERALELGEPEAIIAAFPERRANLAVPTWFYGFEPVNRFATHVAKYFANSIREDGLLAMCLHGIVYAEGGAGTVQEVFMDAEQNAYATLGFRSPMALLGAERWDPAGGAGVFPALAREAAEYREMVGLCGGAEEAAAFIRAHPPQRAELG